MRLARTRLISDLLTRVERSPSDEDLVGDDWVDHKYVVRLAKQDGTPLWEALKGTGVYFPPQPPPPPRSQEYEELMARLRVDEQERQYRSMLQEPASMPSLSSSEVKEVKEQLTTILNIMISIVAIAWAFWYWTASWDVAARTLTSLFGGIGIGVAECVVYLGYKRRVAEARATEKTAKEKRNVVKKVVFNRGVETITEPEVEPEVEPKVEPKGVEAGVRSRKHTRMRRSS